MNSNHKNSYDKFHSRFLPEKHSETNTTYLMAEYRYRYRHLYGSISVDPRSQEYHRLTEQVMQPEQWEQDDTHFLRDYTLAP
jgi:hypothetical protein